MAGAQYNNGPQNNISLPPTPKIKGYDSTIQMVNAQT